MGLLVEELRGALVPGLGGEQPRTLDEVGRAFNVTRERIRQIEKRCLQKLSESSELQDLQGVA